jgi:hypothetical protein
MTPALRICARLRDEFSHKKISQRRIAQWLSERTGEEWSQTSVQRVLAGGVRLLVDDLFLLAELAQISPTELVREPGKEFVADLTPSELRLVLAVRDRPKMLDAVLAIVGEADSRPASVKTRRDRAAALPVPRKPW